MPGLVKCIYRAKGKRGREVLRVIVDYYDGAAPDFQWKVIWDEIPVNVVVVASPAPPLADQAAPTAGPPDRQSG